MAASPEEEMGAYYSALGEFVHYFAYIEGRMQHLLWIEAGTPPEVARAVFSGVSMDTAIDNIRRLYESRRVDMPAALKGALDQLKLIYTARNLIVHYGAQFLFVGGTPFASKERTAHKIQVSALTVDAVIVRNMIADLHTVVAMFNRHEISLSATQISDESRAWQANADRPWLYTPEQRPLQAYIQPKTGQTPKPQP